MSVRDREEAVVARLHQLAPSLDGEPDPAFREATRARLVAMAAVRTPEPVPASGLRRLLAVRVPDAAPARWRARLTAGLAGAALTVTALATLVAVADGAGPGDVLYDLKRGTEQTQLALAGDARGRTLLDLASTRLDEVQALVGEGGTALPAVPAGPTGGTVSAADADPALVLETLATMDAQTQEGTVWLTDRAVATADAGPLDELAGWAAGQAGGLAGVQDLVPDAAEDAVGRSLTLLTEIGARTDALQAALTCPAGPAVGGTDDLGPVPAPCAVPAAPPVAGDAGTSTGTSTAGGGAPEATTPPPATGPPATGSGSGGGTPGGSGGSGDFGGSGGVPTPGVPIPSPGGGLIPSLPTLPRGGPGGPSATQSPPVVSLPPVPGVTVCLPPVATVGDC